MWKVCSYKILSFACPREIYCFGKLMVNKRLMLSFITNFWGNLTVFCLFHFNIISSFWKWQMDFWGAALGISKCLISLKICVIDSLVQIVHNSFHHCHTGEMAQWAKQWTSLSNFMGEGSKPEQLYIFIYYFFVFI